MLATAIPAQPTEISYRVRCARCHGENGDGRGPAAASLALNGQPPRDFTSGAFRYKSTLYGTGPTDADLGRVIGRGLAGTSMPGFADVLDSTEIDSVAAVVRSFSSSSPGVNIEVGDPPADESGAAVRGADLYRSLGCPDCHGDDGRGNGPRATDLRNEDGTPARIRDLTRPWDFRGGQRLADVTMRLATGIMGTPMPSYLDSAPLEDLWAVGAYVRTLARAENVRASAIEMARRPPGDGEDLRSRGEYLVKSGTCFLCHVQMNPDGSYASGSFGAGGMKVDIETVGTVFSRNLTPDPDTGLAGWTAIDVRRALRDGRSRDGRRLNPLDMPWTILAGLTDRDADAIHAYLMSLPPVRNRIPPPVAPSIADVMWSKLVTLVQGRQIKAGFYPENSGSAGAADAPPVRNPIEPFAVMAGAAIAIALWLLSRRRARLVARLLGAVAIATCLGALVYTWPPLSFMPTALIRAEPPFATVGRLLSMPPLRPPPPPRPLGNPDLAALAERGRYVATIGTCPLCHTAGPSVTRPWSPFPEMGGGMKVSWKVFGTTYSRNLTPDRETGLGNRPDSVIRRAITGGIATDGRHMHWQAMPWDHFSNLRSEDVEALIFYLRSLPPAWSKVPRRSKEPGNEQADTFYFGYTGEYRP